MMSKDHKNSVVDLTLGTGLGPTRVCCQIADVVVGRMIGSCAACLTDWKVSTPVLVRCHTGSLSVSKCSLRGLKILS